MDNIILLGGGTAGHITPNIALLPFLNGFNIHYVGAKDSLEQQLIAEHPSVTFHPITCVKLVRGFDLRNLAIPFKLSKGKSEAKKLLKEINPKVIFSKGGYVSLPVMLVNKSAPMILHESDFSMGLANKMVAKKCKYVCTSFENLADTLENGICTGSPLRQELYFGDKKIAEKECGLTGRRNLLIMGGSLGAKAINEVVSNSLNELCCYFDIVHITGKGNTQNISHPHYFQLPYTSRITDYFAWADFCISRGGANSIFELIAKQIPSLIIPLPKGNSRGDQVDNAEYFLKKGYVKVLSQDSLTAGTLMSEMMSLIKNENVLIENMKKANNIDGTRKIAELILKQARI